MISNRETQSSSIVSHCVIGNIIDCGFILGMSTDAFGILLGNVIYAVYIGVLSDKEPEGCENGRRVRQGHNNGIVSW